MGFQSGQGDEKIEVSSVLIVAPEPKHFHDVAARISGDCAILEAETAKRALDIISEMANPEELVLIFACQELADMKGVQFLRESLRYTPRAMRILHGKEPDPDFLIESINRARVHHYIGKNFDQERLREAISRFLAGYRKFRKQNVYLRQLENRVEEQTLALEKRAKELEELNLTDTLTGLRNRRYLLKYLNADVAKVRRDYFDWDENEKIDPPKSSDLVFFMLTLDQIDTVYDTYGQAAGNGVLIHLNELLSVIFRECDYLVRWNSETFLVVARFIRRCDAPMLAERICNTIAEHEFFSVEGDPLPQTCSVGFAAYPFIHGKPDQITWSHTLDIAEHAMRAAAVSGGHCWLGLHAGDKGELVSFQSIIAKTKALIQDGTLRLEGPPEKLTGSRIEFPDQVGRHRSMA